jgi:stress response protein YsnF
MKIGSKAFQNEEFYIPLRHEEAVVEKETRVREQYHARKGAKTEHKTIADDVRKEDIEYVNQEDRRPEQRFNH